MEYLFNLSRYFREMFIKNFRKILGVLEHQQYTIQVQFNSPQETIDFFKNLITYGTYFKGNGNSQILLAQDLLLYSKFLRCKEDRYYFKNSYNINFNLAFDIDESQKNKNQEVLNWIGAIMRRVEVKELIINFLIDSSTNIKIERIEHIFRKLQRRIQKFEIQPSLGFQVHFTQTEPDYTSTILYVMRDQEIKRSLIVDTDSDQERQTIKKIQLQLRYLNFDRFELHTANSYYRQHLYQLPFDSAHKEIYFDYMNNLPQDIYKQKALAWTSIKNVDNESALSLDELDSQNVRLLNYIIRMKEHFVFDGNGNALIDQNSINTQSFQKLVSLTLVTEVTLSNFSLLNTILSKIKSLKTLNCRNLIQCPINIQLEEHSLENLSLDMVYYSQQIVEEFVERNLNLTLRKLSISGLERDQRMKSAYNLNWILSRFTFMASHKKFKAWTNLKELDICIKIKPLHLDMPLQKDGLLEFVKSLQTLKLERLAMDLPFDSDQLQLKKGPKTQWIKDYFCGELLKISRLTQLDLSSPIKQKQNIVKNGLKWEVDSQFQIEILNKIMCQGIHMERFSIKGKNSFNFGSEITNVMKQRLMPLKLSFEYPQVTKNLVKDLVEFQSICPQHQICFIEPSEFDQ
ncbi:hypothetical protein FGO68_gene15825 [Halteria grandinella]|uniref:Uncharacterized protein n=1 Tax=Halteria grandinella TaxID=5974 RepID=A0A8J8T4D0_HALGN|nr:hypothetical protein FGO68_gene15825 [Halteria grandinella]